MCLLLSPVSRIAVLDGSARQNFFPIVILPKTVAVLDEEDELRAVGYSYGIVERLLQDA